MLEQMKWEDAYALWKKGDHHILKVLSDPISAETVMIKHEQSGCIYGYDWLDSTEAQERKLLIERDPVEFLYFTKPSNKGTTQTAQMLVEARNEEELAAVWIAATAKELCDHRIGSCAGNKVGLYADILYMAACEFLKTRYHLWHHSMRKLVPRIVIPLSILENVICKDATPVVGLIQTNAVLLKSTWSILRYSSLKDGESVKSRCRINSKQFKAIAKR